MSDAKHVWVIVLAAGDGSRVRNLTRDCRGRRAPKQFTSTDGRRSLLGATLDRARRLAPAGRIVPVVAAHHERWWKSELEGELAENTVIQPRNRGTAAGILLPLLWIAQKDSDATVVIMPSDHHVESESTLHHCLEEAVSVVKRSDAPIVMLGVEPERPEEEYGWIVPCPGPPNCPHRVRSFKEKPDTCTAVALFAGGALLNTFLVVAEIRCLLTLFESEVPELWRPFCRTLTEQREMPWAPDDLSELYRSVPSLDFSRDILERAARELWVYPLPSCGWIDLGTPARLRPFVQQRGEHITNRARGAGAQQGQQGGAP